MSVLILNFGRCSHGRCYFCGYGRIRGIEPTDENVTGCFKRFFEGLDEQQVKVYGSGSFLDEKQVPAPSRKYFIRECLRNGVKEVTVESRPEYINKDVLSEFSDLDLTVAMGLECSDELVLEKLDKGYGRREYEAAAKLIHEVGARVRTYLLVNPPYVSDVKASLDESVEYALEHSDTVVLINTLPHKDAPLMRMWVSGEWSFLGRQDFKEVAGEWEKNPRVELDEETFKFTPAFTDEMREDLTGVGEWYLTHPHIEVWQDYINRWYQPPPERILLFLPCSFRKPYSDSKTHQGIIGALGRDRGRFHEVMLSSCGVIPREFEGRYPFDSYDWSERQETAAIKERYVEVTAERIRNYYTAHGKYYLKAACFLKYSSESYQALAAACSTAGIICPNLLKEDTYERVRGEKRPLQSREALDDLREGVKWCLRNSM